MSDLTLVEDNLFTVASETFSDNLSASISAGATTVPVNSNTEYTDGDCVVLTVDPGTVNEATFIGKKDGLNFIECYWTEGNLAVGHSSGATIVDYDSATHHNAQTKGIKKFANDDGTLKATAIQEALGLGAGALDGWEVLPNTFSSAVENGNRSVDMTFATSVAPTLTPGMRIQTTRTVTAPLYMGGAFNGTNHYFTKVTPTSTLASVTNNFTLMAFYEPTSYAIGRIMGRLDSTPNNGFSLYMEADGRVTLGIFNGGTANFRTVSTYQSLPLNKKTHVTASWASGTVVIYFDGVSVPVASAVTGGTAPTTAGTGGDWSIGRGGAYNAQYANGYISGVGAFNAVLSQATIRSYKNQALTGSETNCIGAWSLNNTGVNQQASGTNDLTATNSVGYTARSPYTTDATGVASGTLDWGIVTKVATTIVTVQYPEGCAIPTSGGISSVAYSSAKAPYKMPIDVRRWELVLLNIASITQSSAASGTWYNNGSTGIQLNGQFDVYVNAYIQSVHGGVTFLTTNTTLSTSSSSQSDTTLIGSNNPISTSITQSDSTQTLKTNINTASLTPLYLLCKQSNSGSSAATSLILGLAKITAILSYL